MTEVKDLLLTGERAMFGAKDTVLSNCSFEDGESPLKESEGIELYDSNFGWKYPLWYASKVYAKNCTWQEMARAGVWYTKDITVEDAHIDAPKNFRRCTNLTLKNVEFTNAAETLWHCNNVTLVSVRAKGDYLAMDSSDMTITGMELEGNYPFDGCRNITIKDSRLISKDAFWNCENVTVSNCYISGEYLGWNSKNLTFENCTIESLQGLCYIENLKMINCKLVNTTLAFEYVTVDAIISGKVDSVINPSGGRIVADEIATLIMDPERVDVTATQIVAKIGETLDRSPVEEVRRPRE